MGFIVELPGAFVRGPTEREALGRVRAEATAYLKWSKSPAELPDETLVVQRHNCELRVEDADSEILLDADRGVVGQAEFSQLAQLATYSGQAFSLLYNSPELIDWIDPARDRTTFYGQTPKTIRETLNHVNRTQNYYLSRAGLRVPMETRDDFQAARKYCMTRLEELFNQNGNSKLFDVDNEEWTLKKILRRFIWHDRIHAKAILRIRQKQKNLGLIRDYENPFRFNL